MNAVRGHRPDAEIAAGNPYYTDDQFASKLGTSGRRRLVENRWRIFGGMLRRWRDAHDRRGALTVLDAGCGDGINLDALHELADGAGFASTVVGADYSPLRVSRARRFRSRAHLHQASVCALPFRGGSFDVVLCNHVLEHVPDLAAALSELRRVLRPGGLLIIGVPNEGCFMARARNHVLQRSIARETDHVHFFTARTLTRALQDAGLTVRAVERETFFFPLWHVNYCLNELRAGHWCMDVLRRLFPSQAGGLIVACEKPLAAAVA